MPAVSKAQRAAMAIAEHEPEKLFKRNRGLKKMSRKSLHDFASTKTKDLPKKVARKKKETKEEFMARRAKEYK
jgi:hypothetical protein